MDGNGYTGSQTSCGWHSGGEGVMSSKGRGRHRREESWASSELRVSGPDQTNGQQGRVAGRAQGL